MADSERALGRLDRALALLREADLSTVDRATQIELLIVESGVRRDQGLADAAVVVLQVPELKSTRLRPWSARLFYAYADALLGAGREEEARDMFARAAVADPDGQTDAADRLNELDGVFFEDSDDEDLDDEDLDGEDLDDEDPDDEDDPDGEDSHDVEAVDVEAVDDEAVDDEAVDDEAELEELDSETEAADAEGTPGESGRVTE
jgi:tetratricopeptide (TPR) repeat protein